LACPSGSICRCSQCFVQGFMCEAATANSLLIQCGTVFQCINIGGPDGTTCQPCSPPCAAGQFCADGQCCQNQ
jgi:hypothetical protein